ncbi:MAG: rRNA maturation RNase YbeY [Gammaproteobacteria bacterium]|nr:rRNA maturation RNase YbeY [Gammaproteobacteria bacterium]
MTVVEVQTVAKAVNLPTQSQIEQWINTALQNYPEDSEIVVRIVDETESAELNKQYRNKAGATNILSFPADLPDELGINLLGDLVVCAPVLAKEALEQQKNLEDHWAHILIHGVLHLLGYDHLNDNDASIMENKEIELLQQLQISNPYLY